MTFSYDPAQLQTSALFQLRLTIGDTDSGNPIFQDEELLFLLDQYGGDVQSAAIDSARRAAAKFARLADQTTGKVSTRYSQLWDHYRQLADDLEEGAGALVGVQPYLAGQSVAEWELEHENTDLRQPRFRVGIHDEDTTFDIDREGIHV